jgi:hypothetical protein
MRDAGGHGERYRDENYFNQFLHNGSEKLKLRCQPAHDGFAQELKELTQSKVGT